MKQVAILGATGSIGASALDVIARHPEHFRASVLSAHQNVDALADLCAKYRPGVAIIADAARKDALAAALRERGVGCAVAAGPEALSEAAGSSACDTVIAAIVGAAGLQSTLAAATAGKRLLLANKEAVVMAGPLLRQALREGGGTLIPVDSEHNALFQCLPARHDDLAAAGVRRLLLTASGGPFRGWSRDALASVTPDQACAHPNWAMGRKISVDSATLMNKGLEVIEAHVLFNAPIDAIEVVVHPQSVIHSLVEYVDGSHLAQLGNPDMRTALAHALAWPDRVGAGVGPLDLAAIDRLDFEAPDTGTFRCLPLAWQVLRVGGDAATVLNAANEVAVAAFLEGKLPFLAIAEVIEATLDRLSPEPVTDIDTLVQRDLTAREAARSIMGSRFAP